MRFAAIVTAAGSGSRMGMNQNKVLLPVEGKPLLHWTLTSFVELGTFDLIVITHSKGEKESLQLALEGLNHPFLFVEGGATRQESVHKALESLNDNNIDLVLIHDGARPWISKELIQSVSDCAVKNGSAVPVTPSVNAMKRIDIEGRIVEHLERESTVSAQTPQAFNFQGILDAHRKGKEEALVAIDDTQLWGYYHDRVHTVKGEEKNIKITYKKDLY